MKAPATAMVARRVVGVGGVGAARQHRLGDAGGVHLRRAGQGGMVRRLSLR